MYYLKQSSSKSNRISEIKFLILINTNFIIYSTEIKKRKEPNYYTNNKVG